MVPSETSRVSLAAPIGVFDSGIGGLSVLRALQAELPQESFVYLADSGHAPWGERGDEFVRQRSLTMTEHLRQTHGIKALVVACNTATAAAVADLRQRHADLPIIGLEPAVKPALAISRTKHIGVLATQGTLASERFKHLLLGFSQQVTFVLRACPGLAEAIEKSVGQDSGVDTNAPIKRLCQDHLGALGVMGSAPPAIDTVVLGCTHYPLVDDVFHALLPADVKLIETGPPVARQTRHRLAQSGELCTPTDASTAICRLQLQTTGDADDLTRAATRWLGTQGRVQAQHVSI